MQSSPNRGLSADDRLAIQDVLTGYGVFHDARDFTALAGCFVPDAEYTMTIRNGATVGPRVGRDAIVDQIRAFKDKQTDQRRHLISNFLIKVTDDDHVEVTSYVVVTASTDSLQVVTAGVYRDTVVRGEHGWAIAVKALELDVAF